MYRLVVSDFDGTLVPYFGTPMRPAVDAAMRAVVDSGRWISISTGRGYPHIKPALSGLTFNGPLVTCNGGMIIDEASRRVLYKRVIPLALARAVVNAGLQAELQMLVFFDDLETIMARANGGFVLRRDGVDSPVLADPLAELTRPPAKILIRIDSPEHDTYPRSVLEPLLASDARLVLSTPRTLDVIPSGSSKATALEWLAGYLGVRREETMSMGDSDNDAEMLEWAGVGVAMGNATEAAKASADWIAPDVEEDGAAVALQRFVLAPIAPEDYKATRTIK